jgi:RHS repeat-associated protein
MGFYLTEPMTGTAAGASCARPPTSHSQSIRMAGLASKEPHRGPTSSRILSSKYRDEGTGLVYYGYRYHSATVGRWVSRDPAAEQVGVNVYLYSANTPAVAVDRLGLFPCLSPLWLPAPPGTIGGTPPGAPPAGPTAPPRWCTTLSWTPWTTARASGGDPGTLTGPIWSPPLIGPCGWRCTCKAVRTGTQNCFNRVGWDVYEDATGTLYYVAPGLPPTSPLWRYVGQSWYWSPAAAVPPVTASRGATSYLQPTAGLCTGWCAAKLRLLNTWGFWLPF